MALGTKCILGLLMVLVMSEVSFGKIPRMRRSAVLHRFVRGSFDDEQYLPYFGEETTDAEPTDEEFRPEEPAGPEPVDGQTESEYYQAVDPTDPPEPERPTPEPWGSSEEPALSDIEANAKMLEILHENYERREVNPLRKGESVAVGLRYRCARFDEKEHVLTSRVWLQQTWRDRELEWDPSDYNGIREIRVPQYILWLPDLKVYNELEREDRSWDNAVLESSGKVLLFSPKTFKTVCRPQQGSNSHHCSIQIGSWTYDSGLLPLSLIEEGFWIDEDSQDCPYTVSNPRVHLESKKYDCCEDPYQTINYTFTIQPNDYSDL